MYLVGLPRIADDLNASEAQLHIAFSVYLAGMAAAMLFAGKVADRSGESLSPSRRGAIYYRFGVLFTG